MASSKFWKEREEEFRRHANDENNSLAADWYSITDSWTFRGGSVGRSERIFQSLAREAARGLKAIWELARGDPGSTPYGMESTALRCGSATEEHTTRSVWII